VCPKQVATLALQGVCACTTFAFQAVQQTLVVGPQDENEEEEVEGVAAEVEDALAKASPVKGGKAAATKAAKAAKAPARSITWSGASSAGTNGAKMYK